MTKEKKISGRDKLVTLLDSMEFGDTIRLTKAQEITGLSAKSIAMHLSWMEAGSIRTGLHGAGITEILR